MQLPSYPPKSSVPNEPSFPETLKNVKHILAVASGKGGVGKSTAALQLALAFAAKDWKVGLLDADIYGPSQPTMMGLHETPFVRGKIILPLEKMGLKMLSMGNLAGEEAPVIWRGPMVDGVLRQFLAQVEWGTLDLLVVDLPPGTGDAQLTLTQRAPLSGAVIVTTPQNIALIDARRGLKMFQKVNVPVFGIIENMSSFLCDGCGKEHFLFRRDGGERIAEELDIPLLGKIPFDPRVAECGDSGEPIFLKDPHGAVAAAYRAIASEITYALQIPSS